jgi:hypothetical protein
LANALYPLWKLQLYSFVANNNLSTGNVKVALIDTGNYTYSAAHQFFSSVSGSAIIGTPQVIANKTFTIVSGAPVFNGDDVSFTTVTGNSVEALIIYIDTTVAATSPLVAYIDSSVTGLPVTPNGGNIGITWDSTGIFAL